MSKNSVLFLTKKRYYSYGISYGLINSCSFIANYLNEIGIPSEVVSVVDNNVIDRVVTEHKPFVVFVEALWVVPEKFRILCKLHPKIKWVIRVHSKAPFLAGESIAIKWIKDYLKLQEEGLNIEVSFNNEDFFNDMDKLIESNISYLPNIYYPKEIPKRQYNCDSSIINISSFGANRLLKNQLQQAIAAILFAEEQGKILHFHMNESKVEKDFAVSQNIKALFEDTKHKLVLHTWLNHKEFLELVASMQINMQVSLSESFNIVSADSVACGIPTVLSEDITWASFLFKAIPTDTQDIIDKLTFAYTYDFINLQFLNKLCLKFYNYKAKQIWKNYFKLV